MTNLGKQDALIVVDVQKDFCRGGALEVPDGDAVVPLLNQWLDHAKQAGSVIVATRDWHPPDHVSFDEQGGPWPVHCVQETEGAAFHPDLQLPEGAWIVSKGDNPEFDQYSGLDRTGLTEWLRDAGVQRVWIGGLAMDVCVKDTVRDACEAGFDTHVIRPATRAVNVQPGDGDRALEQMRLAGAHIEEGGP